MFDWSSISYRLIGCVVAFFALVPPADAQMRWHVDAGASAGGDGLSWATAFRSPNEAFLNSMVGDEVWVKAGTYLTDMPLDLADPRTATFNMPVAVGVYGGFDGTETSLDQRAGLFEQTILTGDLGQPGVIADNAYSVVTATFGSGIPPGVNRLNGFTIRDGNSNMQGGGVRMFNVALVLRNCIIRNNYARHGGGFHGQPALVRITWCQFIDNHALERGGAVWGQAINMKISHTTFSGNSADRGGALFLHSIANTIPGLLPVCLIHNSLFHDNEARIGGAILVGGAPFASGKATFSSCTIAFNTAKEAGGGLWAGTDAVIPALSTLFNCIVQDNQAPVEPNLHGRHNAIACNIENGTFFGTRNISSDARFVDGPGRNLRLRAVSPCVDVGGNALLPIDFADANGNGVQSELQSLDLDGRRRFQDEPSFPDPEPTVDMGAFEH